MLESGGWWVAPSLPVPVGVEPTQGVDGEYHQSRHILWRESAGAVQPFLSTVETETPPGRPFQLLWFGDAERFTIADGTLEVEDLFSVLRVSAERGLIERLLIRGRRLDPGILEGIGFSESPREAEMEVRRPIAATTGRARPEPAAFLSIRTDVKSVEQHGTEIIAETVHGGRAVFSAESTAGGWRLQLTEGPYGFRRFLLDVQQHVVSLKATPAAAIDPMAPGMRGRLAFDLRADLVALG